MSVENLLKTKDCPPLVFSNMICDWPSLKWNPEYLSNQLKDQKFKCKLAPQDDQAELSSLRHTIMIKLVASQSNLWESECLHVNVSIGEFMEWLKDECKGDNPLTYYKKEEISCYIDYKYMKDMFQSRPDLLKEVNWSVFGLDKRNGHESTIWIGSAGCYTNCHYDTYGFNLIAQIYGRKKWTIFPPWCTPHLYPTRIPYEESSVFSQVNMKNPDLKKHPQFRHCEPYIVILEPGQVMYLPKHWWHFVECLEPSISINTWVEMDNDKESQIEEAITRLLFSTFLDVKEDVGGIETAQKWINSGEDIMEKETNINFLQAALRMSAEDHCKRKTDGSHYRCESMAISNSNDDDSPSSSQMTVKTSNNFEKFTNSCANLPNFIKTKTCTLCYKLCCYGDSNTMEMLSSDSRDKEENKHFYDQDHFDAETKRRKIDTDVCGESDRKKINKNHKEKPQVFVLSPLNFEEFRQSLTSMNTLKKFEMVTCESSSHMFCECGKSEIAKMGSKQEDDISLENMQKEIDSHHSVKYGNVSKISPQNEKWQELDVDTVICDQETRLSPLGQSSSHEYVLDKFVRCLLHPSVVKTIAELMKEDNG